MQKLVKYRENRGSVWGCMQLPELVLWRWWHAALVGVATPGGVVVGTCYQQPNQKKELNCASLRRARWRVQEAAGCPVSSQSFGRLRSKMEQIPWKAISHHIEGQASVWRQPIWIYQWISCLTNLLAFCKRKAVYVIHLSLGRLSTQSNIASLYGQRWSKRHFFQI